MDLEHQEVEAIAALKDNFGFKLLIDKIQAEVDNIKDDILTPGYSVDKEQVIYWRALNSIYKILRFLPDEMEKEFLSIKENFKEQNTQINIPQEYLEYLKKEYFKKKGI